MGARGRWLLPVNHVYHLDAHRNRGLAEHALSKQPRPPTPRTVVLHARGGGPTNAAASKRVNMAACMLLLLRCKNTTTWGRAVALNLGDGRAQGKA